MTDDPPAAPLSLNQHSGSHPTRCWLRSGLADGREEGIYSDFSDRIARAREAGTEIIGVGVCREASLLVTLDKQRVVEHLQAVDGVVDETFALVSNRYCEVVDVVAVG